MHHGHVHLLREIRRHLGADAAVVGVMSGDFVQRGDFAIVRRQARARAAVESGMDLVLELPLPWAAASAERFADGGVQLLLATGLVTCLAFGSECGDGPALLRTARALLRPELDALVHQELRYGDSYAAARQRALSRLLSPEDAALLGPGRGNNILGIEYCKALLRREARLPVLALPRLGASHDGAAPGTEAPFSSAALRAMLREGRRREALEQMSPAMGALYQAEEAAGRAPVLAERCQRAVLSRLRSMELEEFAALDQGGEGLYRRLYAARTAPSLEEFLSAAKTRRYAYARLRRMALWAYLGLTAEGLPEKAPYLRVLAANETGRGLLAEMRKTASLPVVTKPAGIRRLDKAAQDLFHLEAKAASLHALAYPRLSSSGGPFLWRDGPAMV